MGRWSTDNSGLDIRINGQSTGNTADGFLGWYDFEISSGFVQGVNTLDFVVNDFGQISGFRAEFLSSEVQVPAPAGALVLYGMALMGSRRRR